jgi:hypothetical protein
LPAMILAPEPIGTAKNWKAEDQTRVRRNSAGDGSGSWSWNPGNPTKNGGFNQQKKGWTNQKNVFLHGICHGI